MNNKKLLLISIFLTIFSIGLATTLLQTQQNNWPEEQIGAFLFEKTNEEGVHVNKIVIKTAQMQLSLYYQNKFWHVKEADGYYADLVTINNLFQDINNAKIDSVAVNVSSLDAGLAPKQSADFIEIQTYNDSNKLLDSVLIGARKNNSTYVSKKGQKAIYLTSSNFDIPKKIRYWLQQPLISIAPENIESLILQTPTGQQLAYRPNKTASFFNLKQQQVDVRPLLEKFLLFMFEDVKKIQNTPIPSTKPEKVIVLFPYSGLIYGIEIYKIEETYWIKIDLSISRLPTKVASDYIKDSLFLYKDWIFKINSNLGKYLLNYSIN